MSDELNLVRDLAVILVSAGLFTIISKALKQPPVLGYILAGLLVGPHISFFPGITSHEAVSQWSEIGMIFLMFGLGLEFSFRKLLKVGSSAIVAAGTKFIGVFILGFVTAQAMAWSLMESIFLGGLLSMSSTMVVIKSYEDLGLKEKPYSGMVFGTLVVEDLTAILLMVLLSTMAVSQSFAGKELMMNILKLVFFLILCFLVGIFLIPTALRKVKGVINDEILLIVSIGLCFGMVFLANAVGFSSALGAFVMGSILSETVEGEHIERIVSPLKNLFGAVFFVSVGMMIDPGVLKEHWLLVIVLSLIVAVSHIVFAGAGILLTGKGLDNAVKVGFSLAQLGEFGFIIAGVGCSLGVMRSFIYPVIIAVSVITTFTTPYTIKAAPAFLEYLRRKIPPKWLERLEPAREYVSTASEDNEWKKLLSSYFTRILLYGVVITAIYIGTHLYLGPLLGKLLPLAGERLQKIIGLAVTLVLMSPFLYGLGINSGSIKTSVTKLLKEKERNVWPIFGLILLRSFIATGIVLGVVSTYFHMAGWMVLVCIFAGLCFILAARRSVHRISALEEHFLKNLNARESSEKISRPVSASVRKELEHYNVFTKAIEVPAESSFAGALLKDIPFRSRTGANIIKISRGSRNILVPSGEQEIFPGDRILVVGTREQIEKFQELTEASADKGAAETEMQDFKIEAVTLNMDSFLTGKSLRSANLRKYGCMVISVLHEGDFITNPEPDFRFKEGDTIWIAGDVEALGWI
ncbi:MAG: cation:proton antiporter [Candidatus Cryptobacteroides sp.]